MWFCLAAAQGDADALIRRDATLRLMTHVEIAEGDRLVRD